MVIRNAYARLLFYAILAVGGQEFSKEAQALVTMACDGALMLLLAWLTTGYLKLDRSRAFPLSWPRGKTFSGAALGVLIAVVNTLVIQRYFPHATASSQPVATFLQGDSGAIMHFALGFGLAVFCPVVEEIYFRGLIQQAFDAALPFAGVLVASFLFINEHPGASASPAIWILGLALGLIYYRTKSIAAAIACHVVNNCVVLYVLPMVSR